MPDPQARPLTSSEYDALMRRLGHDPRQVSEVRIVGGRIIVTEKFHTEHQIEVDD